MKIKERFIIHKKTLKRFLLFIGTAVAVVFFTSTVIYSVLLQALQQEVKAMNCNIARELCFRVEEIVEECNQLSSKLISDTDIRMLFTNQNPENLFSNFYNSVVDQLKLLENNYIDSIILYSPNTNRLIYSDTHYANTEAQSYCTLEQALKNPELYDLSWMNHLESGNKTATIICTRAKCDRWPYYLSLIKHYHSGSTEGIAVINIDLQKLYHHLITDKESVHLYIADENSRVILCEDQETLYTPSEQISALSGFRPGETFNFLHIDRNAGYAYAQEYSTKYGLTYVAVSHLGDFMVRLSQLQNQFLTIVSLASLIVIAIAIVYSLHVRRPLQELRFLLQNTWQETNEAVYAEEIRDIAGQIIGHLQTNLSLQRELDSQLHLLQDSQMLALQAQINPHFLFNTLNVISMMIESECGDGHPIAGILNHLSNLLRYSLSDSKNVCIREELTYTEQYIAIMKYRYQDFQVDIETEPQIMKYAIPKLVLQPLIENALQHGLFTSPAVHPRLLKLRIYELLYSYGNNKPEKSICLDVLDNGAGMTPEKLHDLRQCMQHTGEISREHIGLSNIARRFYLLFHTRQHITIHSSIGAGTHVCIIFPAIEYTDPN